jgi:hypothetical protein
MNTGDKIVAYEFQEILADCFSYAMKIDKIHIAFYFYKVYKDEVFTTKELCVQSIIDTFNDQSLKKVNAIPYLEERLYMMELLISDIQYP